MSLIFMDGFDHYSLAQMTRKWDSETSVSILTTSGRRSSGCMEGGVAIKSFPALATYIFGFAFWQDISSSGRQIGPIWQAFDGTTRQCEIELTANGGFLIQRSSGTEIGTVDGGLFPAETFNYLEIKCTIGNSGNITMRLNGTEIFNETVDNQNSANATMDSVQLGLSACRIDDFYILNTSGSAPRNDFLGDCQIETIFPESDGTKTEFDTVVGSATHSDNVDETPSDDDTTYNETTTVNDIDLFDYPALTALSGGMTVFGVQVNTTARKDDAGSMSIRPVLFIGGTEYDGTTVALATSYNMISEIFEQNPDGGPGEWTESIINGAEFGVEAL
ncbi:MAG: hypothetical protein V3W44_10220 [Dehalococcoidales bacterium]